MSVWQENFSEKVHSEQCGLGTVEEELTENLKEVEDPKASTKEKKLLVKRIRKKKKKERRMQQKEEKSSLAKEEENKVKKEV